MNAKVDIDHNRVYHLEDTMIMYGIYNSHTLMDLIKTVHQMHNVTTWKEKIFVSKMNKWLKNELANIHNEFNYSLDAVLFLTTIKEKYVRMYEKFIAELKSYLKAIRVLSKGYLPISLITPSKLEAILKQVTRAIAKTNQDYKLVLNRQHFFYNMKLVTFGIDSQKNLIIQFPVFVQPYTQTKFTLYQIETVPVPTLDTNNKIQSYTQLKIEKPYIALNDETYISIHAQELNTCKRIGYEYFCEELFVVKSKHKYSCAGAVYFNSNHDIKESCDCYYYHNWLDVTSSVLGGGCQIIFANWPNYKRIICTYNSNIPVNILAHPYVLLDRNILCKCDIEVESNFLLESLATRGEHEKPYLEMYFTVNLAFVDYLEELNELVRTPINRNWTSYKQTLPISLESFQLDSTLLHAPVMLRDFINQYQENRITATKRDIAPTSKFRSFINNFLIDMLVFIAAILTVFTVFVIIYVVTGQSKLKVLVATMALQGVRAINALDTNKQNNQSCNSELLKILIILNLVIVVSLLLRKVKKSIFFQGQIFSNMVKIKLFLADTKSYVALDLNKITRNTHLFKLTGELSLDNITLIKNWIWDVLEIQWDDIHIILNDKDIHLPATLVIPLINKLKVRKLFNKMDLVHVYIMLKQRKMLV